MYLFLVHFFPAFMYVTIWHWYFVAWQHLSILSLFCCKLFDCSAHSRTCIR